MGRQSAFQRHPKKTLTLAALAAFVVALGLAEVALSLFFPTAISANGFVHTRGGRLYGWGFDAGQIIRREDPDTGEVYFDRANGRGWRDRERALNKPDGVYRIVALGDSNTFGFIVPADKTYTRILEDRLRAAGYAAEVPNMGISGWGTDQALEALRREGVLHRPDLVIMQFDENDLGENLRYRDTGKFGRRVPFYYEVGDNGEALRRDNPRFREEYEAYSRRRLIAGSEILKRLWHVRGALKALLAPAYRIGAGQFAGIRYLVGEEEKAFLSDLHRLIGRGLDREEVVALVAKHGLQRLQEGILKIAENRQLNQTWPVESYYHNKDDGPDAWTLYFALMRKAKEVAHASGAAIAVLSVNDLGFYEWNRAWFRKDPGEKRKREYLETTARIGAFAKKNGIGFVENVHKYERARYDHHPNAQGNAAIAENIYLYLMENHKDELLKHRLAR